MYQLKKAHSRLLTSTGSAGRWHWPPRFLALSYQPNLRDKARVERRASFRQCDSPAVSYRPWPPRIRVLSHLICLGGLSARLVLAGLTMSSLFLSLNSVSSRQATGRPEESAAAGLSGPPALRTLSGKAAVGGRKPTRCLQCSPPPSFSPLPAHWRRECAFATAKSGMAGIHRSRAYPRNVVPEHGMAP